MLPVSPRAVAGYIGRLDIDLAITDSNACNVLTIFAVEIEMLHFLRSVAFPQECCIFSSEMLLIFFRNVAFLL